MSTEGKSACLDTQHCSAETSHLPQIEEVTFDCYGLTASLEPCVGLLLELAGDSTWLSWEDTQKFAEFLRRHAAP